MAVNRCPLCGAERSRWHKPSGVTTFKGREFRYRRCLECRSLFVDPMPDTATLHQIYGPDYAVLVGADGHVPDPRSPDLVIEILRARPAGVFVDYGCGDGRLLVEAEAEGWTPVGVEFDPEVARPLRDRTGCTTHNRPNPATAYRDASITGILPPAGRPPPKRSSQAGRPAAQAR